MAPLFRSAVARAGLVAQVVALALVGSLAGCLDDGVFYSSGEPPFFTPATGGSPECGTDFAAPSQGGASSRRLAPPARAIRAPAARAQTTGDPGVAAADEPDAPAGFNTFGCEHE